MPCQTTETIGPLRKTLKYWFIFFYLNSIESRDKGMFPSHQAESEQSYNHSRSSGLELPGRSWRGLEVPLPSSPHPAHSQTKPKCKTQTVLLKMLKGFMRDRVSMEKYSAGELSQLQFMAGHPGPTSPHRWAGFANIQVLLAVMGKAQQEMFQLLHVDHTLLADWALSKFNH